MSRGVSVPLCAENRQKENKRTGEVKYLKISSQWQCDLICLKGTERLCRRGMSKGVVVGYQVNTKIKKMEQYQSFYSIDLLPYNT